MYVRNNLDGTADIVSDHGILVQHDVVVIAEPVTLREVSESNDLTEQVESHRHGDTGGRLLSEAEILEAEGRRGRR